jgi:hypothetical protein
MSKPACILPAGLDWALLLLGAPLLLVGGFLLFALVTMTTAILIDYSVPLDSVALLLLRSPQLWVTILGLGMVGAGVWRVRTRRRRLAGAELRRNAAEFN